MKEGEILVYGGLAAIGIVVMGILLVVSSPVFTGMFLSPQIVRQPTVNHSDFTYMPHYVKFHIIPEQEGLSVAAWASDDLPPTTGYTDKNSDVVLELLSVEKYNIWIPERKFSVYIYPRASEYIINAERIK